MTSISNLLLTSLTFISLAITFHSRLITSPTFNESWKVNCDWIYNCKPTGITFGEERLYSNVVSQMFQSKTSQTTANNTNSSSKTSPKVLFIFINFMLCGDIQSNPGPPYPCVVCSKGIRSNSKAISCDNCLEWTHVKCTNSISIKQYNQLCSNDSDFSFECNKCLNLHLPLFDCVNPTTESEDVQNIHTPSEEVDWKSVSDSPDQVLKTISNKGLNIVHLNVRSLLPKIDEIHHMAITTNCSILGISETWLDDSVTDAEIQIAGYVVIRKDRNRQGGGVCIYIKDTLAFNIRSDIKNDNCEFIFLDVLLPKTKPILVGVCYRPPDDSRFLQNLENNILLSDLNNEQETYILGDFNIDYSKPNSNLKKELSRFMNSFHLDQIITCPTRITESSCSTIDLILISDTSKISNSGVINSSISDHCIIYCCRKISKDVFGKHNTVKLRSLKNYDQEVFTNKLRNINWYLVTDCEDINKAWKMFSNLFMSVIDQVAPVKQVRLKQKTEMWFTSEIVNLIRQRDHAYNVFIKSKSSDHHTEYKRLRNLTQSAIKHAKQNYVKEHLTENSGCIKKLWKSIKNLGFMGKIKAQNINIGLRKDNDIVFDKKYVANKFNSFFCNIAQLLVEKLPPNDKVDYESVRNFYADKKVKCNNFKFDKVSENEVYKLLDKIDSNKATGLDNIGARFIKDGAKVISLPISYLINLSFEKSAFPEDFKQAKVVPLYKKGDKNFEGNYRPVSILPVISKIFERAAFNQIDTYLSRNSTLYNNQSGFRSSYSTDTALTYLSDSIRKNMDKGKLTGLILLDLQKAFDTVNHSILTSKLKYIGFDTNSVSWVASYLSCRKQFVEIGGTRSDAGEVKCGVPQGSILGPLLFILYINDMSTVIKGECSLYLYADDSALAVSGTDIKSIEKQLTENMNLVSLWLSQNRLSLHLGKTECILFGTSHNISKNVPLNIICNNIKLQVTNCVKYLGCFLDGNLSGNTMFDYTIKKINSTIKFLYRNKKFLTYDVRKMLVNSLVQPRFDYACSVWYRPIGKVKQQQLQRCQNKCIRFVLNTPSRHHIEFNDFEKLNYLNVTKRVEYLTLCNFYNIVSLKSPSYLQNLIVRNTHSHNTRKNVNSVLIPRVKSPGKLSFFYNGSKMWNNLDNKIKSSSSKQQFKTNCKKLLMEDLKKSANCDFVFY